MNYQEIAQKELKENKISWCQGQCGREGHKRGFRPYHEPVVHLEASLATRSTLYRFFHELGHAVLNHNGQQRAYVREAEAEQYAISKLKEYNIPIPRKMRNLGARYVARKKRHGDRISKALTA